MVQERRDLPSETQALARARRALLRGRLLAVAEAYEAAARAREREGLDGSRHRLRALEFWTAAGASERGLAAARRLLARARRSSVAERAGIRLARAVLWAGIGRHREAARDYEAARKQLGRDPDQARAASLGLADSLLRLGETERAGKLLADLHARALRSRNRRGAATALYRLALFLLWSGDDAGAGDGFAAADHEAEALHMRGLRAAIALGRAEALLRGGLAGEARAEAERAITLAREVGDDASTARAQLLLASCLRVLAAHVERDSGRGAASGLRRHSLAHARRARASFARLGDEIHAATCRLEEARVRSFTARTRAGEIAASTVGLFEARGLEGEALEAKLLARACRTEVSAERHRRESWAILAQLAERLASLEAARHAWLREARAVSRPADLWQPLMLRALEAHAEVEPVSALRFAGDPLAATGAAPATQLADATLDAEAEPKEQTLGWTLIERARMAHDESRWVRAHGADVVARAAGRVGALSRALYEDSRAAAGRAPGPLDRLLRHAREGYSATVRRRGPRLGRSASASLRSDEALIVFAKRSGDVHAWVRGGRARTLAHFRLGPAAGWRLAARAIQQQVREASGWPDSVVPDGLVRASRRALEAAAFEWWTPLWPALEGVCHLLLAPDPDLPALPWPALLLLAPPLAWPRPRSIWLVPSPAASRPPAWRLPQGRGFALAERSAEMPLAEREARGVARIVHGEWMTTSALGLGEIDPREALLARLRPARLWHAAVRLHARRDLPAFSHFDLEDRQVPLWWLGRRRLALRLAVFSACESSEPKLPPVGRVVGQVGPLGARPLAPVPTSHVAASWDSSGVARVLIASGIERVVVNSWPVEDAARAPLLGSFYAGLARGDSPGVALLLAQRKAHEEGLHPALWAGLAAWGWP